MLQKKRIQKKHEKQQSVGRKKTCLVRNEAQEKFKKI